MGNPLGSHAPAACAFVPRTGTMGNGTFPCAPNPRFEAGVPTVDEGTQPTTNTMDDGTATT